MVVFRCEVVSVEERFLASWADIIAGAMMKEKESAHFARNDSGGEVWASEAQRAAPLQAEKSTD